MELAQRSGWSLDAAVSPHRAGVGLACDVLARNGLEVDLGIYALQGFQAARDDRFDPSLAVGLAARF